MSASMHNKAMRHLLTFVAVGLVPGPTRGDEPLAKQLRSLDAPVLRAQGVNTARLSQFLALALKAGLDEANLRESKIWNQGVHSKATWEAYRDERIARLRGALGQYPEPPANLHVSVRRTLEGDGY